MSATRVSMVTSARRPGVLANPVSRVPVLKSEGAFSVIVNLVSMEGTVNCLVLKVNFVLTIRMHTPCKFTAFRKVGYEEFRIFRDGY